MRRGHVLALDQGSSGSRALLLDDRGCAVAAASRPVRTARPQAGRFEHDALELARSLELCLEQALAALPAGERSVVVGLACQRSTVVFWDRRSGRPAAVAPSWQDGRAADLVAGLSRRQAWCRRRTGLYLTPYYSAPKIAWFLQHCAAVQRLAESGRLLAAPVASYLVWRWSGGEVFAADPTTAQRMLLLDLRALDWDADLLSLFGVPREILPEVRPGAGAWAQFKRAGRLLRLMSVCGDQQAAFVGLGGREDGRSVANYGTGAFWLHAAEGPRPLPGLLCSAAATASGRKPSCLHEGTVHAAGTSLDWLRD
ncbi:MAG: glycerol kinase, partial [Elusimicrobia bacterium]|nr:glycerol kinase [Elusimicrobiota bacterium]